MHIVYTHVGLILCCRRTSVTSDIYVRCSFCTCALWAILWLFCGTKLHHQSGWSWILSSVYDYQVAYCNFGTFSPWNWACISTCYYKMQAQSRILVALVDGLWTSTKSLKTLSCIFLCFLFHFDVDLPFTTFIYITCTLEEEFIYG